MKRGLLFVALVGCMPDANESSIEIDLQQCREESVSMYLPFGSVYVDVKPRSPYLCELTLGGETENPNYDGSASQRCVFVRLGTIDIDVDSGGPAYLENRSNCVDL